MIYIFIKLSLSCCPFIRKKEKAPIEYQNDLVITSSVCCEFFNNDDPFIDDFLTAINEVIKDQNKLLIYVALVNYLSSGLKVTNQEKNTKKYIGPLMFNFVKDKLLISEIIKELKEKQSNKIDKDFNFDKLTLYGYTTFLVSALYFEKMVEIKDDYLILFEGVSLVEHFSPVNGSLSFKNGSILYEECAKLKKVIDNI